VEKLVVIAVVFKLDTLCHQSQLFVHQSSSWQLALAAAASCCDCANKLILKFVTIV
jgi:hypothetical protein